MRAWVLAVALACAAAPAYAAPEVVLPRVDVAVPAAWPAVAVEAGVPATVSLELDVDETGAVVDATVTEITPAAPLDDTVRDALALAALTAARATRFLPATVDGVPAPATIGYVIRFDLTVLPVRALEGVVREAGTRVPRPGVTLSLDGPDDVLRAVVTGADGSFVLYDLPPGTWTVTLTGPGLRDETVTAEVTPGEVTSLTLFAVTDRPWEADAAEVVRVVAEAAPAEITQRAISTAEAMALPGTNGDIIKAVINFPGVARPPLGIGQLIVRGTGADSTRYYVDGVRIPNVFHFGGLSTVINGDGLEEIRFLTGNYSVRYGDGLGGVVDLATRSTVPDRSRGYVSIDVYQAAAFAEIRASERTAITASFRRSYADAVLGPILGAVGGGDTFQAPRYYDAQLRVLHRTPTNGLFDAQVLVSDDQFRLLEPDGSATRFGLSTSFVNVSLGWRGPVGESTGWRTETRVNVGPERRSFTFGDDDNREEAVAVGVRQEFSKAIGEEFGDAGGVGARLGVDLRATAERFRLGGFATTPEDAGATSRFRPAVYAETLLRMGPVDLVPGLRATLLALPDTATVVSIDPRLAARVRVTDTTALRATVGRFSEDPLSRELLPEARGEPDLRAPWSLQASVGLDQDFPRNWGLEATAFWSELRDLVVGRGDRFEFTSGPPTPVPADTGPYANDGLGRAFGLELLVRHTGERAGVFLSATVSRATRTPRPGETTAPFAFDQTVVLNALGTYKLPKGWTLGGRFRFGTGNPYVPVSNRYVFGPSRTFVPVFSDEIARIRPFWAVDLRVDKTWTFRRWALTFYLDIQNITDPGNTELIAYTFDFSEVDPIRSQPPLPAFGLKGAW